MTKIFLPPKATPATSIHLVDIFLAGSIEMGKAINWQTTIGETLESLECVGQIYNPRRDDWDSTWIQSINDAQFNNQVNWELNHIEQSDIVFIHFEPETMSPITLAELGYVLGRLQRFDENSSHLIPTIIVSCPDNFWRKGNVEIMVDRANTANYCRFKNSEPIQRVTLYSTLEDAKNALIKAAWSKHKVLCNYYGFFSFYPETQSAKIPKELQGLMIPKNFELHKYLANQ